MLKSLGAPTPTDVAQHLSTTAEAGGQEMYLRTQAAFADLAEKDLRIMVGGWMA